MAGTQNLFLILSLLLLALTFSYANADTYKKSPAAAKPYAPPQVVADVVVEGMVYCQSCNYSGTWSLTEAEPISGAKISVICRNYKERISHYKVYTTNTRGYFYAKLDSFSMKHRLLDHPLQSCTVKLVASPIDTCNVFTNVNYGINGAPLRYEKKRVLNKNYEAVIYAAGPLAFRSDHCLPNPY